MISHVLRRKAVSKVNKGQLSEPKRRFRSAIYVDVFVPKSDDLEKDREYARKIVEGYAEKIPNSFVVGVGYFDKYRLRWDQDF